MNAPGIEFPEDLPLQFPIELEVWRARLGLLDALQFLGALHPGGFLVGFAFRHGERSRFLEFIFTIRIGGLGVQDAEFSYMVNTKEVYLV